jgi:lysophospholipase L1-like esterase
MKYIIIIIFAFILRPSFAQINFTGKRVTVFGTSIAHGWNSTGMPTDKSHSYVEMFCAAEGATSNNLAVDGTVFEAGDACGREHVDSSLIPVYNASVDALLLISYQTNDIGTNNGNFTPAGWKARMIRVINYAITVKGWPSSHILIAGGYYMTTLGYSGYACCCGVSTPTVQRHLDYLTAASEAAIATGCLYINFRQAMMDATTTPDDLISSDHLHPNDEGHAVIAESLISFFAGTTTTPGNIIIRGRKAKVQ